MVRTCSDLITEIFMNIKSLHHSFSHVKQMSSCQCRLYIFLVGSVCVYHFSLPTVLQRLMGILTFLALFYDKALTLKKLTGDKS